MNLHKKLLLSLLALFLFSCSDGPEELEPLVVELNASTETPNYNESFELSWSSNASQCYASGGYWSGERPTTGSEEITLKRGGQFIYILECRRNNEFKNQAVEISVNKTPANHFIFSTDVDPLADPMFVVDVPDNQEAKVTAYARGDFNDDFLGDIFLALQFNEDGNHVNTRYFQLTGGAFPVFAEIEADNCKGSGDVTMLDINRDSFDDVVVTSFDSMTAAGNFCIFSGSETGLALNNELVANDTDLDFNNANVKLVTLVDRNADSLPDLYLLTSTGEYWVLVNAEDGPAFEKAETVVDLINDYTITGGTVVDFDGDANLDIVMAGYDESENGVFVAVPRFDSTNDWDDISVVANAPLAKIITGLDFDGDPAADLLVIGDQSPSNMFEPTPTTTFRIYEQGDINILDNETDISFPEQGSVSLNRNLFITDYDLDIDGGDFLLDVDKTANAFASFVLGIKDIIVNEEEETVTYEINTISDVEMELGDIFGQDSQLIFLDTDLDFDLDILVAENYADNNVAFYLRLNESND